MAGVKITQLPEQISALDTGDYFVFDNGTNAKKVDFDNVASSVIDSYDGSTLAGSAQSVASAISTLNTNLTALTSDVGSLLITRYVEVTGTMTAGSRFDDITAPAVTGYTFFCWLQPASIGNISALYMASPASSTSAAWCVATTNPGSNKTVRFTAVYVKTVGA